MKNITNILIVLVVASGIFFGYKWFKNSKKSDGQTYAVVVGVSDYLAGVDYDTAKKTGQLPDLNFCDDDAKMFYNFLLSAAGGSVPAENIKLLIDNQASKAAILNTLEEVFGRSTSNDRVIFYFAGHGANGVFVPYDVVPGNSRTELVHKDIKDAFKKCHAKTRLCFADACMSGSMKNRERGAFNVDTVNVEVTPATIRSFEDPESGLVVLMAARSYQYSMENPDIQHGFFTKFLVDGLEGQADKNKDQLVTIKEAFDYLYLHLSTLPRSGPQDKGQIPVIFGKYDENLPVAWLKSA